MKVNTARLNKPFDYISTFIYGCIIAILGYSVVLSGYKYVLDTDELLHAHVVYLLSHGETMFTSFFSVYSPLFHWFLLPLFSVYGFRFETIEYARLVMIGLFLLRLILGFLLTKKIFGKVAAFLFIPLHLLDPFAVFTAMQIRPDNLMVTCIMASITVLAYAFQARPAKQWMWVMSGALMALAFAVNIKAIPSIGVVLLCLFLYGIVTRHWRRVMDWGWGAALVLALFSLYFMVKGSFWPMLQQLFFDAKLTNSTRMYPVPPGAFYRPDNFYLFGLGGRSINWIYAWILPLLGAMGSFGMIQETLQKKLSERTSWIPFILAGVFAANWLALLFIYSVFIQYYIPLTWVSAITAAAALSMLYHALGAKGLWRWGLHAALIVALYYVATTNYQANINRATLTTAEQKAGYTQRWAQIPENQAVFPDYLFRPSVYAISYGYFIGEVPKEILNRFTPIEQMLEEKQMPFILIDSYATSFLPEPAQAYIQEHYESKDAVDPDYRTRK